MFCSGQPLEPTRVLTADSVTASITVNNRLQWFTDLKGETLPLLWKGPPALAHPTHRHHSYLSEITKLNIFFMWNGCLWTTWGQKASPWSLKNVLGLNSCGSSPSVSFQTSRNWSTLPWKGSKKRTFYSGNTSVDLSIHTSPALHSLTGALTLGCCRCFSFCSSILFSSFSLFSWSKLFRYSLLSCSFSIS